MQPPTATVVSTIGKFIPNHLIDLVKRYSIYRTVREGMLFSTLFRDINVPF